MLPTRVLVLILAVFSGSLQVAAQTPPKPGPEQSAPVKAPAAQNQSEPDADESAAEEGKPGAEKAASAGKRAACRAEAKAKRLRGMERADSIQLCAAEGRLDCVKQAIAKKTPLSERKAFLKACMN